MWQLSWIAGGITFGCCNFRDMQPVHNAKNLGNIFTGWPFCSFKLNICYNVVKLLNISLPT
jgi:hypothetical protein